MIKELELMFPPSIGALSVHSGAGPASWMLLSCVASYFAGGLAAAMLVCGAAASAYGARAGLRVLKPVPISVVRRERVGL